jgi:tRNA(fMet)-specific endonuclease VapC
VIVADADVLIDWLHRRGSAPEVRTALERQELATTAVGAYELWTGARTEKAEIEVRELLSLVAAILPFDDRAAALAGAARRELASAGRIIGRADLYVAGICLAADAPLLTRNRRELERIRGLRFA